MTDPSAPSPPSVASRLKTFGRALLVLALGLAATEVALRVLGIGAPDPSRGLATQQVELPILRPDELDDGTEVWCTVDPRMPVQCVPRAKTEDALRVFLFGGSSVGGLHDSPNVTFGRHLERLLGFACPEREIEVVNLGMGDLSSAQVRFLVEDVCRNFEPDALIVQCGSNEFLVPRAERHAESQRTSGQSVAASLRSMHLARTLGTFFGATAPVVPVPEEEDARSWRQILEELPLLPDEGERAVDVYETHLRAVAGTASRHGVPLFLMTAASNWQWRGRLDLPKGWVEKLATDGSLLTVRGLLDTMVESSSPGTRHEWLFKRAELNMRLGEHESALADYRLAMNTDPRLRRAPDVMGERMAQVADDSGAILVDTVAFLSENARHGIVGFDEFYDHGHFTSRGAVLVAGELYRTLAREGVFQPRQGFNADLYVRERLTNPMATDRLGVYEWTGANFWSGYHTNRNPRKYARALAKLDRRIEEKPRDAQALVFRGNARFFEVGGRESAEADYRAALEINPKLRAARLNLEACARDLPRSADADGR